MRDGWEHETEADAREFFKYHHVSEHAKCDAEGLVLITALDTERDLVRRALWFVDYCAALPDKSSDSDRSVTRNLAKLWLQDATGEVK